MVEFERDDKMTHVSKTNKHTPQRLWFLLMWCRRMSTQTQTVLSHRHPSLRCDGLFAFEPPKEPHTSTHLSTDYRCIWILAFTNPRFCYFKCIEVIEVALCNPLSRLSQDQLAIRYGYTEGLDPASLTAESPFLIDPFFEFFWAMNNLKNSNMWQCSRTWMGWGWIVSCSKPKSLMCAMMLTKGVKIHIAWLKTWERSPCQPTVSHRDVMHRRASLLHLMLTPAGPRCLPRGSNQTLGRSTALLAQNFRAGQGGQGQVQQAKNRSRAALHM